MWTNYAAAEMKARDERLQRLIAEIKEEQAQANEALTRLEGYVAQLVGPRAAEVERRLEAAE